MRGIAASFLIVGDGETPPLPDAALLLDDHERIVALGPRAQLARQYPSVRLHPEPSVLLPGLVNAHTHLELSALRGRVPGGKGFGPWVAELVSARERHAPERDGEAIEAAVSELLSHGVVAVGEVTNQLAAVGALAESELLGCVFHEVFGLRRDTAEAMLALARRQRAERVQWPANLRYSLAPHTPYTLHPAVLSQIVAQVRASHGRTSLHLAEHPAERIFLQRFGGPFAEFLHARSAAAIDWEAPGADSVTYADALGALGPEVIAVHLCDARPAEVELVAKRGCPVVLCPRSNLHIELKLPPLLQILHAGCKPGLGTDSLASNTCLDPLREARALHARFPTVAARTLLAMATSYGAVSLGLAHVVGRLAVGLAPGVVAFDHGSQPVSDPERFVLEHDKAPRRMLSRPAYRAIGTEARA